MAATERKSFGKGAARSMRRDGMTPAVLYGEKNAPRALTLETATLRKSLVNIHGRNAVVTLEVEAADGAKTTHSVIVKEVQKDPIVDTLVHVDFQEISLSREQVYALQVDFVGTPVGVDLGGFMNMVHSTVQVKGLPMDIPDSIEVDVTNLNMGESICCKDLPIPANITLLEDGDAVCVVINYIKGAAVAGEEEAVAEEEAA